MFSHLHNYTENGSLCIRKGSETLWGIKFHPFPSLTPRVSMVPEQRQDFPRGVDRSRWESKARAPYPPAHSPGPGGLWRGPWGGYGGLSPWTWSSSLGWTTSPFSGLWAKYRDGKTPNYFKKNNPLIFSLWVKILARLRSVWPGKAPRLRPAAGK